jgi:hypothetical protein
VKTIAVDVGDSMPSAPLAELSTACRFHGSLLPKVGTKDECGD